MIALDTNVLVRVLVEDDAAQAARARRLIAACAAADEPCFVTTATLCELEWVLDSVYGAKRADVVGAVRTLLVTAPSKSRSLASWRGPSSRTRRGRATSPTT